MTVIAFRHRGPLFRSVMGALLAVIGCREGAPGNEAGQPSTALRLASGSVGGAPRGSATVGSASAAPLCGMPAELVARGWPTELNPTQQVEPNPVTPGTLSLVVLPDTQYYASCASPHLPAQAAFVQSALHERNIQAVIQLGDLTDHNEPKEWEYVQHAFQPLGPLVPLLLATGNHDHGPAGSSRDRNSLFQSYFSNPAEPTRRVLAATMVPGDLENAYFRIPLPRTTLGVMVLEWAPRTGTVAWANQVLSKHSKDRVVVVTHAYLYHDGSRYNWKEKGPEQEWNPIAYGAGGGSGADAGHLSSDAAYDGEMLWEELVSRHAGIFLTLSGHVLGDGAGVLASPARHGNLVHQVLANYQMLAEGGLGYLRLLEFLPDGKTLRIKTYSPSLKRYAVAGDQSFDLEIKPPLW